MPCHNRDHNHEPWPWGGEHRLLIEACETHCGWCDYQTEHASNLRVHARRHVANPKYCRLSGIAIVASRAGRSRVVPQPHSVSPSSGQFEGDSQQQPPREASPATSPTSKVRKSQVWGRPSYDALLQANRRMKAQILVLEELCHEHVPPDKLLTTFQVDDDDTPRLAIPADARWALPHTATPPPPSVPDLVNSHQFPSQQGSLASEYVEGLQSRLKRMEELLKLAGLLDPAPRDTLQDSPFPDPVNRDQLETQQHSGPRGVQPQPPEERQREQANADADAPRQRTLGRRQIPLKGLDPPLEIPDTATQPTSHMLGYDSARRLMPDDGHLGSDSGYGCSVPHHNFHPY